MSIATFLAYFAVMLSCVLAQAADTCNGVTQVHIVEYVVEYPLAINSYFPYNTVISINEVYSITINNAPTYLSIVTATSTSTSTVGSTASATATPGAFIIEIAAAGTVARRGLQRRQSVGGFVGNSGTSYTCGGGTQFTIDVVEQLIGADTGLAAYAVPNSYTPLVPTTSPPSGAITSSFVTISGSIFLQNATFTTGIAAFCVDLDGVVNVGSGNFPSGCTAVSLTAVSVNSCAELNSGTTVAPTATSTTQSATLSVVDTPIATNVGTTSADTAGVTASPAVTTSTGTTLITITSGNFTRTLTSLTSSVVTASSATVTGSAIATTAATTSSLLSTSTDACQLSSLVDPGLDGSYEDVVIYQHNVHRANHSAPCMTYSTQQAANALVLANTCVFAHNTAINGGGYGQNLAATGGTNFALNTTLNVAQAITNQWYNGEVNYFVPYYGVANAQDESDFEDFGHFTQVVWTGSTSVGCATVLCGPNTIFGANSDFDSAYTVCDYSPAGNVAGEFDTGVNEPLDYATITI